MSSPPLWYKTEIVLRNCCRSRHTVRNRGGQTRQVTIICSFPNIAISAKKNQNYEPWSNLARRPTLPSSCPAFHSSELEVATELNKTKLEFRRTVEWLSAALRSNAADYVLPLFIFFIIFFIQLSFWETTGPILTKFSGIVYSGVVWIIR